MSTAIVSASDFTAPRSRRKKPRLVLTVASRDRISGAYRSIAATEAVASTTARIPGPVGGSASVLDVVIERTTDCVAISHPETGVFGSGPTVIDAINDLYDALRGTRELLETAGPLSPKLQRQLAVLISIT